MARKDRPSKIYRLETYTLDGRSKSNSTNQYLNKPDWWPGPGEVVTDSYKEIYLEAEVIWTDEVLQSIDTGVQEALRGDSKPLPWVTAGPKIKVAKVTLVKADDWAGIYVDGSLRYQGHSIPDFVVLESLDVEYTNLYIEDPEPFFYEAAGHLPPTEEELTRIIEATQ